jgi:chaperone required for assembly of F1-ATPase
MSIKRFYKSAAALAVDTGFAVAVDGKPVKTPAGSRLIVASQPLAAACAAEWEAQGETIEPHTMPLTQLAATALDRVGPQRDAILGELLKYAGTDLLCYRGEFPPDLARRQHAQWQPLLDWAGSHLGAQLAVTTGVVAVTQSPESVAALEARLAACDTWTLTAVQAACAAAGSLVLALALADKRLNAAEVFTLSQLEETYQIEQWGEDYEATLRRATLESDIKAAGMLLELM